MNSIICNILDVARKIIEQEWNNRYLSLDADSVSCNSYCFSQFQCRSDRSINLHELIVDTKLQLAFMYHMLGFVKLNFPEDDEEG